MIRITDILDKIYEYNPTADTDIIDRAYIYSARVHEGQVRLSGEPYLSHPLEVADILAQMRLDMESIAAALLHDVIEDTPATKQDIIEMFGPGVAHIVEGVTKLSVLPYSTKVVQQAESLRKMILAMADDIRVVLIKLADRIHNMRTLKYHQNPEKQAAIAQETLDIYAPIAARLGIFWMKYELEEIAFFYTQPEEYERIDALVNKDRDEKEEYIRDVKEKIHAKMKEMGLECEIKGRYKQHYSIYQKMISQNLEFKEVYDIVAFRVILDTVPQCYAAMGAIHSMWKPIYYKIKDYIGNPKPNMYQSIHTTVVGPKGERIEIQIRTQDMDEVAESGIAAHWSYKEGTKIDEGTGELFAWIRNLVENQENYNDPDEFLENVRIDLYPDQIYIFTPSGEIKTLPKKATPVDFAYLIHTEVGARCSGAKVNGKLVPLAHELKTGDTVEIVTTQGHNPSPDWLNFVKTVKARNKIRAWINAQEKERSYSLGKEMCEKTFKKRNQNFNALIKSGEIKEAAQAFGFKTEEDLIAHVGFGKLTPLQVFNKALPELEKSDGKDDSSLLQKIVGKRKKKETTGVIVKGLNDILVKFSKCCNPLPGDPIIGYITQGQGVTIHRKKCLTAMKMSTERMIDVQWSEENTGSYPARIKVRTDDRFGLLADIASVISRHRANIISARTETNETGLGLFHFTILVESTEQLRKIMSEIRKVKKVLNVRRIVRIE
ncbi:MAG: bifunctional (p)ppGpp synthetase/guanosine-3',5'-bis(diphosphate) 3'-pyrophosphohydrolase [Proteobacteria bacterium]|nr:bifunctional (p)ppGpp synthetase/guanosine-3',5'-bis(diphosphate) 3'-pyrophosphohydrolase [Pseudomonadota bacterium]MBU1390125.1 bifunctional (p)ppGpp synthetase/guanosine-3',5'-bis(diphosphate) 3'-pyrophosphohydrolase [Pseudomonadota bacterium]MBU1544924.1 bifunctional (p)ppGpp synthetase/guanosine-3',5'-bis(diphosphate) 3'-pyrophosphohydrolase [Pseudomonadota bacterium]MBU2482051.1 bifunctional (p)ppGpp synthetase/guanosine-3',5'-bis(diphosphate) 3'-pyrophosphohydrolase [Pseudomonadota bact